MDKIYGSSVSFEKEWQKYSVEEVLRWNDNHPHLEIMNSFLKKYKKENIKMIDGGSGIGRVVIYFQTKGYKIYGVEYVYSAIQKAKRYDSSLSLAQGDLRILPFHNDSFDVYYSIGVIEHDIYGPDMILQEAKRILKPQGLLFISIPTMNNFYKVFWPLIHIYHITAIENTIRRIFGKQLIHTKEFDHYIYDKHEFRSAIEKNGFRIIQCLPTMHIPGIAKVCLLFLNRGKDKDVTGNSVYFLNKAGRIVYYCTKQISWMFPNFILLLQRKYDILDTAIH